MIRPEPDDGGECPPVSVIPHAGGFDWCDAVSCEDCRDMAKYITLFKRLTDKGL